MSSTLKNLLFWVVLIVVGILIWNFSTNFQQRDTPIPFSQFIEDLDKGNIETATIEGNYVYGTTRQQTKYRTYAPSQYEQLGNRLIQQKVKLDSKEPTASPWAAIIYAWAPLHHHDRLLDLHHAADAERREQGPVVRQEPREALLELAEEGDVQGRRRRRRGEGGAPGDHRVPQGAAEVPEARRPHSQGRAADGLAGHRQDAARARRRRRGQRPVLLDLRFGLRRDVRRRRRLARPRPVRAGQEERAVHHLHRRDRRGRPPSRRRPRRRPRRARADAESAARRDGRLRVERGRDPGRRDQPSRRARSRRCCARAASIAASSSTVRT